MNTRRGLFSAAAFAAIPVAATRAVTADAELVAMGAEATPLAADFIRFTDQFLALSPADPDLERVARLANPACARLDGMVDRAFDLRATTVAGLKTKATLLAHLIRLENDGGGVLDLDALEPMVRLAWSLTQDLVTGAVA